MTAKKTRVTHAVRYKNALEQAEIGLFSSSEF